MLRPQFTPMRFEKKSIGDADPMAEEPDDLISVGRLADAKKAALRRGFWFRVLNRVERGVVDLTMRYVDNIKSTLLAKVLTAILDKLTIAGESMVDRMVRTIGVSRAMKISAIAVSWGNASASKWAEDRAFARYLAFCLAKT
jgi:hypothetical protein